MVYIRGTIRNGQIQPDESLGDREGQSVVIWLTDSIEQGGEMDDTKRDRAEFLQLIEDCQISTGIPDLAHNHHQYLHSSTTKRESN